MQSHEGRNDRESGAIRVLSFRSLLLSGIRNLIQDLAEPLSLLFKLTLRHCFDASEVRIVDQRLRREAVTLLGCNYK